MARMGGSVIRCVDDSDVGADWARGRLGVLRLQFRAEKWLYAVYARSAELREVIN